MSVDYIEHESQEDQRQAEEGGTMTTKNDTIIDFYVTTASVLMSVDNTEESYLLTRAKFETPKPSYQPDTDTS